MIRKIIQFYIQIQEYTEVSLRFSGKKMSPLNLQELKCSICQAALTDQDYIQFKIRIQEKNMIIASKDIQLEYYCKNCYEKIKDREKFINNGI